MRTGNRVIRSWGRLTADPHIVHTLDYGAMMLPDVSSPLLALGKARSYGDICLNPRGSLLDMNTRNRFISFDGVSGILRAEAGVSLGEVQRLALLRGWLLPVTPGTQFVTLGGAVANDVHGKNHRAMGSFGDHVTSLTMLRSDLGMLTCGPDINSGLFWATIGGMGLTGIITEVELRLRPVAGGWLDTETQVFDGLDAFFDLSRESENDWEYAVAWLDCTNGRNVRGVFFRANHSEHNDPLPVKRSKTMPFTPPVSMINGLSLKLFNRAYYAASRRKVGQALQDVWSFFYPLDALRHWNRIYGPKGFYQYQSLIPANSAREATAEMLDLIAAAGQGSFLMVLKVFGNRPAPGLMSFPAPGVTFAMDFPNKGQATRDLLDRLDRVVAGAGGRLYMAKDARMPPEMLRVGYPCLDDFMVWRDPALGSAMSRRLIGE